MAAIVYALCTLTSLGCTYLLIKGYFRSRFRLLLWSGLGFAGMSLNNAVLFIDRIVLPDGDLSTWRLVPSFIGFMILIYGLIWDTA